MAAEEWINPRPAIMVSTNRSGSTFLCHALDSHPDIGCIRGEPLNPIHQWAQMGLLRTQILDIVLRRPGYAVAMCKLSYKQFRWVPLEYWQQHVDNGLKVIHLHRENALRVVASAYINTKLHDGEIEHKAHSYAPVRQLSVTIPVDTFETEVFRYIENVERMKQRLLNEMYGVPVWDITYADIMGAEGREVAITAGMTGSLLCNYLGVSDRPLHSSLRRINTAPLSELVTNWPTIRERLLQTDLKEQVLQWERE